MLLHARLNMGLTRRAAAQKIGVAQGTYRRAEIGHSVHPASAKKIADFFDVRVVDLMPAVEEAAA